MDLSGSTTGEEALPPCVGPKSVTGISEGTDVEDGGIPEETKLISD